MLATASAITLMLASGVHPEDTQGPLPLPQPVKEMLQAAIESGDQKEVAAIVKFARQANPKSVAEIDGMYRAYQDRLTRRAARKALEKERALKQASLLDNWSGEGQIGASRATGNSNSLGFTAAIELERDGLDWSNTINAQVDFQRNNGRVTREQYLAAYEQRYDVSDRGFIFGLAQYEKNRFQGFTDRYSLSGGVGYRLIDTEDLRLLAQTGPAWRRSDLTTGGSEDSFAIRHSLDFDWQISERLKLTEDASAFLESGNSTFLSTTGLTAKLDDNLSARVAYRIEHDTDPPIGAVATDTLTRFTLVYGF